jgi:hypothetical protein
MVLPSNVSDTPTQGPPKELKPRRRMRPGLGTFLVSLLGLVVLIGAFVYFGTSGNTPFGRSAPRAAPTAAARAPTGPGAQQAAPPPPNGPTATPADAQAIQQAIQRGDDAQVQALSSKDPSPMQDIGTPEYYQEMVSNNQDLMDAGVVSVKLERIEWGPIVVNGTTATAQCYETWTTTFDDGSVDQSRDLNVYTLVQQNGAWKIQSDDHPNSPGQ